MYKCCFCLVCQVSQAQTFFVETCEEKPCECLWLAKLFKIVYHYVTVKNRNEGIFYEYIFSSGL